MAKFNKKINGLFNQSTNASLSVSKIGNHSIHTVDPNDLRSLRLLTRAYNDVYIPAFPIADERESIEAWMANYKNPVKNAEIVIIIAGENLDNHRHAVIKGMSVGYYYPSGDAGLMAYVAIDPKYRSEGLGHVMVEARKQALLNAAKRHGKSLGGVFLECNDPTKVKPEDDSFDPATRIKIFQKWGAEIIPIDYVQPSLSVGDAKSDYMNLLAYPHPTTGKYPTPGEIHGFIYGIYKACAKYSGVLPEQDADYKAIKAQIDAMPQGIPFSKRNPAAEAKKPTPPANDR